MKIHPSECFKISIISFQIHLKIPSQASLVYWRIVAGLFSVNLNSIEIILLQFFAIFRQKKTSARINGAAINAVQMVDD